MEEEYGAHDRPGHQHSADAGHVDERERAQDPVVVEEVEFVDLEVARCQPHRWGSGHTLGGAGRPGGPADGEDLIGAGRHALRRRRLRRVYGEGGSGVDDRRAERGDVNRSIEIVDDCGDGVELIWPVGAGAGDDDPSRRRPKPVVEFVASVLDGKRHRSGSDPAAGQDREDQLDDVGELNRNRHVWSGADGGQRDSQIVDGPVDLAPGQTKRLTGEERFSVGRVCQSQRVGPLFGDLANGVINGCYTHERGPLSVAMANERSRLYHDSLMDRGEDLLFEIGAHHLVDAHDPGQHCGVDSAAPGSLVVLVAGEPQARNVAALVGDAVGAAGSVGAERLR